MIAPYYEDDLVTLVNADCRAYGQWWLGTTRQTPALIVTDPPYDKASLPLWGVLADLAVAVLPPGAWLVAYTGTAFLPAVMAALDRPGELGYRWCGAVVHPGGGQILRLDDLTVLHEWKPVLVYRRLPAGTPRGAGGRYLPGGRTGFRDVLQRGNRDKAHHPWGQPASEAIELLTRFALPGQLVLDPFAGSGTTLVAAKALGLQAVGFEIEERWCARAAQRVGQETLQLGALGTALEPVGLLP